MSTPQDPNQPQDPADPANPYGTPPPPPAAPGYGQPSYGQPTYGQPTYGQPDPAQQPPPPQQPPAYGDPQQPPAYGQPAYGQPAQPGQAPYGQPGYPGAYPNGPAAEQPASRGLAIASLVLGIIGCLGITAIISLVLGIIALVQGRDGRNHGKGLAITGIVLSIIWLLLVGILAVTGAVIGSKYSSIDDLDSGTCITAKGLSDSGDSVTNIKKVSCSSSHDGEVLATHDLSSSEASGYGDTEAMTLCKTAVTDAGKLDVVAGKINVIGLTESSSPDSGDKLACVAFNSDGSKLSSTLG